MNQVSAYTALVVGATGATGKNVVKELIASKDCEKVIAFTRSDIPKENIPSKFPGINMESAKNKLVIRKVNFDELSESDFLLNDSKSPVNALFCCLGTTRKDAGSAEAFKKVDLEYVTKSGELSKKLGIKYFGLLSAVNAKKDSWFLYPQTKGLAEEEIKNLEFERTSIFRPGLLDRGESSRFVERVGLWILPSVSVENVAKSMVKDYETGDKDSGVRIIEHDIMAKTEL